MKRVLQSTLSLCVATFIGVSGVVAQSVHVGFGAGLTLPLRDYHESDQAGWHVLGKVDIVVPESPLDVRVDAMYSQTSQRAPSTGTTKLAGGTADLVWHVPTAAPGVKPYVVGGAGVYNYNPGGGSTTKFSWGAGLGASIAVGPIHGFVEARYISIHLPGTAIRFVPVTAGLSFGS
ncbi:MAG TPA: outer membrane beta-barrel protein [Gemmatimonadales bacterium]|nr:outer membrane beta-barrel protein [Gemmatimonadales bacterium]